MMQPMLFCIFNGLGYCPVLVNQAGLWMPICTEEGK